MAHICSFCGCCHDGQTCEQYLPIREECDRMAQKHLEYQIKAAGLMMQEDFFGKNKKYATYRNKKTGNVYEVIGNAINATNTNDGQIMVMYKNDSGEIFVREKKEFYEKFEQYFQE